MHVCVRLCIRAHEYVYIHVYIYIYIFILYVYSMQAHAPLAVRTNRLEMSAASQYASWLTERPAGAQESGVVLLSWTNYYGPIRATVSIAYNGDIGFYIRTIL